jgi:hypothetical protein
VAFAPPLRQLARRSEGKRALLSSEKTTAPNEKSAFSLGNAFFLL